MISDWPPGWYRRWEMAPPGQKLGVLSCTETFPEKGESRSIAIQCYSTQLVYKSCLTKQCTFAMLLPSLLWCPFPSALSHLRLLILLPSSPSPPSSYSSYLLVSVSYSSLPNLPIPVFTRARLQQTPFRCPLKSCSCLTAGWIASGGNGDHQHLVLQKSCPFWT